MDKNTTNSNSKNNIKSFVKSQLDTNWPFSFQFTEDFLNYNKYGRYSSLKNFLISTWLEYKEATFYSGNELDGIEPDSESEDDLEPQEIDSWPQLKYDEFFIENNRVFFKERVNQNTGSFKVYTLNDISYKTLICKNIENYIDLFFKEGALVEDEKITKYLSWMYVWGIIFHYLLFTTSSSSILKVLDKKNYRTLYKKEILIGFKIQFQKFDDSELLYLFNTKMENLQKRLENVFAFSSIPPHEAEKLIKDFFLTKNFNEIISYYKKISY